MRNDPQINFGGRDFPKYRNYNALDQLRVNEIVHEFKARYGEKWEEIISLDFGKNWRERLNYNGE